MITIDQLSYTYPNSSHPALNDVSLHVAAGEFVLVAGPSGSGKSTLLRCLNGLVPHFSGGRVTGRVTVNGLNVWATGPHALSRHVGFVLQNPEAQAVLDQVEPEIAFGLENAAVPVPEMRLRIEEVLSLLDLAPLRQRRLATLSGGEQQRVAIATALVLRPQILVLDEPTSQLDPQSAEDVLRALVRLNEDLGLTILLVEHRLERVLRYVDRLIYLDEGRIVTDGPPRQALLHVPHLPPLVHIGRALHWRPLPLTVKEGQRFAREQVVSNRVQVTGHKSKAAGSRASLPHLPASPLLEAADIHFAYGDTPALKGVSLEVQPGEAVALLGRNGSGKTTLLKCLVGLLRPAQGEVQIGGRSTRGRDVAGICREAAYLPQTPDDLLFAETVAEELAVTRRNHGLNGPPGTIERLLTRLGLETVAGAYPRDLSVGQRQRVALGAIMVTRPKLLLLDEPTRGLDYQTKQDLVALWRQWLAQEMGLLLVTHDVELAALVADRVVILSDGEMIAAGKTADILNTSPLFAPQIGRLFPGRGWLTVADALVGLGVID